MQLSQPFSLWKETVAKCRHRSAVASPLPPHGRGLFCRVLPRKIDLCVQNETQIILHEIRTQDTQAGNTRPYETDIRGSHARHCMQGTHTRDTNARRTGRWRARETHTQHTRTKHTHQPTRHAYSNLTENTHKKTRNTHEKQARNARVHIRDRRTRYTHETPTRCAQERDTHKRAR